MAQMATTPLFSTSNMQLPAIQTSLPMQLKPYENAIITGVANTIVNSCTNRGPCTFLFNLCSSEGWQSKFFYDAVGFAADAFMVLVNQGNHPNQILDMAVITGTNVIAEQALRAFPAARNYMNPDMVSGLSEWMFQHSQLINLVFAGAAAPPQQMAPQVTGYGTTMAVNPQFNQPQQPQQMNIRHSPTAARLDQAQQPPTMPFTANNTPQPQQQVVQQPVVDRPGIIRRDVSEPRPVQPRLAQIDTPLEKGSWSAHPNQPHPFAVEAGISFEFNHTTKHIEKIDMDKNKHVIPAALEAILKQNVRPEFSSRTSALQSSFSELSVASKKVEELEYKDISEEQRVAEAEQITNFYGTSIKVSYRHGSFLSQMIFEQRLTHELRCNFLKSENHERTTSCRVYKENYIVGKPILCTQGLGDYLREAASTCFTFKDLSDSLKAILDNPLTSNLDRKAILDIDMDLTRELAYFIRTEMSVQDVNFDSFIDDASSLINYLTTKRAPLYGKTLSKEQKSFIHRFFTPCNAQERQALIDTVFGVDEETDLSNVFMFKRLYTVIIGDIIADELNLQLHPEHSTMVLERQMPALHNFIKENLQQSKVATVDCLAHLYFITTDNRVYEFQMSPYGPNPMIVEADLRLLD
jgi:hypothetical protein